MHIQLASLPVGKWRNLTPAEIKPLLTPAAPRPRLTLRRARD
jgi:16S rRNA U516 pseudouridylate synthase RsuA-like enzyme